MASDTQMIKGILEGCILAVLQKEHSYGYRVVELLRVLGFADISEATVYPILNRLEKKGDISFEKRSSKLGPPRKYYSLTKQGSLALEGFIESWKKTSGIVGKVLGEVEV